MWILQANGLGIGSRCGGGSRTYGTRVMLKLASTRIPANDPVSVRISSGNDFTIAGSLGGQTTHQVTVARKHRIHLKAKHFTLGAHEQKTIKLTLPKALRNLLQRTGNPSLALSATVRDPVGHARTVTPRLKTKRRQ